MAGPGFPGSTSGTGQVVPLVPPVLLMPPLPSCAPAVNSVDATLVLSGQPQSGIDVVTGGRDGWFEDYTAGVRGQPIKNYTIVTRNAAGQTQHVVGNYRPRSTLLLLSRLIGEKFDGTPIAAGESQESPTVAGTGRYPGIWQPSLHRLA